jgi:hypothetical protein
LKHAKVVFTLLFRLWLYWTLSFLYSKYLYLFILYFVFLNDADLNEIRPILPQLLDGMLAWKFYLHFIIIIFDFLTKFNQLEFCVEFFKLMNEVENEDLVFTLETIVDKFGEEMAPYALGLCQNLVVIFAFSSICLYLILCTIL